MIDNQNQNEFTSEAIAASIADQETSIAIQAEKLREYLASCYDCDITTIRCAKTGRPYYRMTDSDLVALFKCAGNSLVKFAERIEMLVSHSYVNPAWIIQTDGTLEQLKAIQPVEFFNFAISNLIGINSYYSKLRKSGTGMLTSEGKFLFHSEGCRFAEHSFSYWEHASREQLDQLNELNDLIILLLAIDGTSKLEKLLQQELSYDWIIAQLEAGSLYDVLSKLINQILNSYRIANGLALADRLTIADIDRIAKATRTRELAKEQQRTHALNLYRLQQANMFKQLKKSSARNKSATCPWLENLVSELMLANNDKVDYLNQIYHYTKDQIY